MDKFVAVARAGGWAFWTKDGVLMLLGTLTIKVMPNPKEDQTPDDRRRTGPSGSYGPTHRRIEDTRPSGVDLDDTTHQPTK